jgi:hypothetical protein
VRGQLIRIAAAAGALGLAACAPQAAPAPSPVVGTWVVKDSGAPFPFHMYVFNADGTMQQANPDAGDAHASDSDGKGIWAARSGMIEGKWVEITADRASHTYTGRAEISFRFKVSGNRLSGTEWARMFGADGKLTEGPNPPGKFEGERVILP